MLEGVRKDIEKLIALYESEHEAKLKLQSELQASKESNEAYRKQIIELERKVNNLELTGAFTSGSGDNPAAKAKIERLIRDIDKCVSLLER